MRELVLKEQLICLARKVPSDVSTLLNGYFSILHFYEPCRGSLSQMDWQKRLKLRLHLMPRCSNESSRRHARFWAIPGRQITTGSRIWCGAHRTCSWTNWKRIFTKIKRMNDCWILDIRSVQ